MTDDRLRLAVPNKGRLETATQTLLADAGMVFEITARALSVPVRNVPVELLFVRTDDVVELVADGVADLGITGLDLLAESGEDLHVLVELGYGHCRLAAAVPNASPIENLSGFDGTRVATAHPRAAAAFFDDKGVDVTLVPLRGSVEVAPRLDVADAIVDLVSSGSTLRVNGLREVVTILQSEAVLVSRTGSVSELRSPASQVTTMVRAVVAGRRKRYVLMNAPETAVTTIEEIIPGLDAPTVIPLAHEGMVAVHSVVDAADLWKVLPELEAAGASGILVLEMEQLLP